MFPPHDFWRTRDFIFLEKRKQEIFFSFVMLIDIHKVIQLSVNFCQPWSYLHIFYPFYLVEELFEFINYLFEFKIFLFKSVYRMSLRNLFGPGLVNMSIKNHLMDIAEFKNFLNR